MRLGLSNQEEVGAPSEMTLKVAAVSNCNEIFRIFCLIIFRTAVESTNVCRTDRKKRRKRENFAARQYNAFLYFLAFFNHYAHMWKKSIHHHFV